MLAGGLHREDAWQRAIELLFERLAVSWTIAGLEIDPPEGAARPLPDGVGGGAPVRARVLREHVAEHFPELRGRA